MALDNYLTEVQELLHDPNATYFSTTDLTNYINRARNRIAGRSQSVRVLLSGGMIVSIAIVTGGTFTNNGAAQITINGAGQQGFATGTIAGNTLTSVTLTNPGWGYVTNTTISITVLDPLGVSPSVAPTFTIVTDNSVTTVPGQEVYTFATANVLANNQTLFPGVQQVMGVISVACAWGANAAMKPLLIPKIWTEFQAYFRSYNTGMENFPTIWSQYGQGANGSLYLWPYPSQYSQMDWDAWCLPLALVNDSTVEAIPYPWTAPVSYYAAYLAYLNAQRPDDSAKMKTEYDQKILEAVDMSNAAFVPDYYESDF